MQLTNEHLTRQLDIIPTHVLGEQITIIGAGAIGSFLALNLAKMGFTQIAVIDYDTVDVVNMNSQFYRFKDIGKPKVQALHDLVEDFTGVKITAVNDKYTGGALPGIVVSAVDSMAVRKLIWEQHKEKGVRTKLIVDPRMSAEFCALYAAEPMDSKTHGYENTLFSDGEAVQERCTAKATMYTVGPIAGLCAKVIKEFLVDETYTKNIQWCLNSNDHKGWKTKGRE